MTRAPSRKSCEPRKGLERPLLIRKGVPEMPGQTVVVLSPTFSVETFGCADKNKV